MAPGDRDPRKPSKAAMIEAEIEARRARKMSCAQEQQQVTSEFGDMLSNPPIISDYLNNELFDDNLDEESEDEPNGVTHSTTDRNSSVDVSSSILSFDFEELEADAFTAEMIIAHRVSMSLFHNTFARADAVATLLTLILGIALLLFLLASNLPCFTSRCWRL